MALWYDSKKREYASDGKNGWFKKYCDTLVSDLNGLFEEHFKGLSNRHNARDVDYDEEMTVRDKLDGIDNDISEAVDDLENKINAEASERKTEDAKLGGRIDAEQRSREAADDNLRNDIKAETTARQSADAALGQRVDSEASERQSADTALGQRVDSEASERQSADTALGQRIDSETSTRQSADTALGQRIDSEASTRQSADTALGQRIDSEQSSRESADNALRSELLKKLESKADKGVILSIDGLFHPGIYHPSKDITITYTKLDGTEANTTVDTLIVSANDYTDESGIKKWEIRQTAVADADSAYFCILSRNGSYNTDTEVFSWDSWDRTDKDIMKELSKKGTWTNPFVVSDSKTDLSTLTTPGIYYFDFDDVVYAITEPNDFGCYTKGYMQVAGLWNDQYGKTVVGQTLYVCNEGQFYSCTREFGSSSVPTDWRISAWVTDITKIDLDGRVKTLENKKGTWADPYVVLDDKVQLSTLKNPGVYRFGFTIPTELKNRGFYNGGYMEVAPVWGDNTGSLIYFQKIYTGYESNVCIYTRTVQGKGVENNDDNWKLVETSSREAATTPLESRVAYLEKVVKSLTGGGESETVTAATDTDAENVFKKYFS